MSLDLLQDLLRVRSVNPPGGEAPAAELLESYLSSAGLTTQILLSPDGRPNLVARLEGPRDRAALVLVSHTDVVDVEEDRWSHDPFGGEIHDDCVWGRGALDMKGIAAMHAAAAAAAAHSATPRARELIVVAVADEETGGRQGAEWLLSEHAELLGFSESRPAPLALGEGGYGLSDVLPRPVVPIIRGEKSAVWLQLRASGDPGHGSLPPARQALPSLAAFLTFATTPRPLRIHPVMREQFATLASELSGPQAAVFRLLSTATGRWLAAALQKQLRRSGTMALLLSDTVTATQFSGGYKHNVVPGEAQASLDARLLPDTDVDAFVAALKSKAADAGIEIEVLNRQSSPVSGRSELHTILQEVSATLAPADGAPIVVPSLTPGMTDLRWFRLRGATAYGWVPLILTPELLASIHGHDERIPVPGFNRAVAAMTEAVKRATAQAS